MFIMVLFMCFPYEAISIVTACKALHWYCDPCDDDMNSGQSMTSIVEKSIVSCFECYR